MADFRDYGHSNRVIPWMAFIISIQGMAMRFIVVDLCRNFLPRVAYLSLINLFASSLISFGFKIGLSVNLEQWRERERNKERGKI